MEQKKKEVTGLRKGNRLKKITAAALIGCSLITLCGCDSGNRKSSYSYNYTFNKAIINNYDGNVMIVDVKTWDYITYEETQQLLITTTDDLVIFTNTIDTRIFGDKNSQTSVEDFARACFGEDRNIVYYNDINKSHER
ncbi:MAG: hypothetical protein GX951_03580 [Mollicutes bacterium]|nr:hypothetical protein [Mollicutes bacterium]